MMLRVTALQIKYGDSNCLLSRALLGQNRIQNQCKGKFFEDLNQHESTRVKPREVT